MRKVRTVLILNGGLCAVFDDRGKPILELQGQWVEVREAIRERGDERTRFEDYRPAARWGMAWHGV
jgi:hypothetical protein